MSARRFDTLADIERHEDAGYGRGDGSGYVPWLKVKDVPVGRGHIVWSQLCQREHHLLNDLQYRYFLIRLHLARLSDIQETKPIPLVRSLSICKALGLKHPTRPRSATPDVLTTSFLLSVRAADGSLSLEPRSVLYEKGFANSGGAPTLEREEIKRVYWAQEGLELKLVTEKQIDRVVANNLETLVQALQVPAAREDGHGLVAFGAAARDVDWTCSPVAPTVRQIARKLNIPFPHAMNLLKLLIWNRAMRFDLSKGSFHTTDPLWEQPTFTAIAAESSGPVRSAA